MVWHGMAWYGMVWYGVVWYGMGWHERGREEGPVRGESGGAREEMRRSEWDRRTF